MTDKIVHFCDVCKRELRHIETGQGIRLNKHEYVICKDCMSRVEAALPLAETLASSLSRLHRTKPEAFLHLLQQAPTQGGLGLTRHVVKQIFSGGDPTDDPPTPSAYYQTHEEDKTE